MTRTVRNVVLAVMQVIVTGITLFFVYRVLLDTIGAEGIGIWSILLATASLIRIAQFGLTGSVVRYTAKYIAIGDYDKVSRIIQSALVIGALTLGLASVVLFPVLLSIAEKFVSGIYRSQVRELLPQILLSVVMMGVSGTLLASLDGIQRIDIRGYLASISNILYLLMIQKFVPDSGLYGLVWAHLLQNVILAVTAWIALAKVVQRLPLIPRVLGVREFREMFGYGFNYQMLSVLQLLYEPITKYLITHFGGLSATGYFEMANRMVMQFRAILVGGNQIIVPLVTENHEGNKQGVVEIYSKAYEITFFISAPFFCSVVAFTPLISDVWIGHYEPVFIISAVLLGIAWWINTLSIPAYFSNVGTGLLKLNVMAYAVIAVANVVLGYLGGSIFQVYGSVTGWGISLILGSLLMVLGFIRKNGLSYSVLLPEGSGRLLAASLSFAAGAVVVAYKYSSTVGITVLSVANIFIFLIIVATVMWKHPVRILIADSLQWRHDT